MGNNYNFLLSLNHIRISSKFKNATVHITVWAFKVCFNSNMVIHFKFVWFSFLSCKKTIRIKEEDEEQSEKTLKKTEKLFNLTYSNNSQTIMVQHVVIKIILKLRLLYLENEKYSHIFGIFVTLIHA